MLYYDPQYIRVNGYLCFSKLKKTVARNNINNFYFLFQGRYLYPHNQRTEIIEDLTPDNTPTIRLLS